MIKIPVTKTPELFLAFVLIVELAYVCLCCVNRLKERSFEHDHAVYQHLAPASVQNRPSGNTAMTSVSIQNRPSGNTAMTGASILAGCILSAAHAYGVPAEAVIGIMSIEGGHIGQEVGPNFNGTYDLGPMQVNSLWVPQLAQLWHVNYQIARDWVRDDGCENVYVGAWILKQKIVKTGGLYSGIAFYHSARWGFGNPYANKVVSTMRRKGLSSHEPPP